MRSGFAVAVPIIPTLKYLLRFSKHNIIFKHARNNNTMQIMHEQIRVKRVKCICIAFVIEMVHDSYQNRLAAWNSTIYKTYYVLKTECMLFLFRTLCFGCVVCVPKNISYCIVWPHRTANHRICKHARVREYNLTLRVCLSVEMECLVV